MSSICPYPGLRPFNEKESIYFKGREDHVDAIINQLQEKHFLMVTGASGDGKSSLIYAGLIPRARAGFFKARFNNWIIADFRPEKNPLKNLAKTIDQSLEINQPEKTYEELSYGFSSLLEVYKSSKYYLDYESPNFSEASFERKIELKNNAANLLILVDQFEELFTNTENFVDGRPLSETVTLNNLIIHTSKQCKEENIPIYIVCTMRSDYIGDCASLKNLPEHIVYSQFFVPRLKRHEIHRAILEPAKLSDNKISNRLIERLINDLSDGQDQLPILQHALNRIWKISNDEKAEQMDLIHYAKCGGLPFDKLESEDKNAFENWIKDQPKYKKNILQNASLGNVLNSHAKELYFQTPIFFKKHTGKNWTDEQILSLLKKSLLFLTKVNDNRAVRNRSTVEEIKSGLGNHTDNEMIEGVINLFRRNENTLILPFIQSNNEKLTDKTTLDITHESLIRNWKELNEWTLEESDNMIVLEDFRKQLNLWKNSNKNKNYLLSEGTLNYFEEWLNVFNPIPFSIIKYDNRPVSYSTKLVDAETFLHDAKLFINESKKAIKRRRQLIIISTAGIIIALSIFTSWALMERNKAVEQTTIADQKTMEANRAQKIAQQEKSLAEKSKEEAIANEALALSAKQEAEKSRKNAEIAEKQALENLQKAKLNAELARKEADRASKALNESELSKQAALKEKLNAEKQEKKATELSYLATAQNLAIKSSFRNDDPELQSLLALKSYDFIKNNGGELQDPIIFDALSQSKKNFLNDEYILNASTEQRTLSLSKDGKVLFTSDRFGTYYKFDISDKTKTNSKITGRINENEVNYTEINQSKSLSIDPDGKLTLWDLTEISNPRQLKSIKIHEGLARKIIFLKNSKPEIISAGKDSSIVRIDYTDFTIKNKLRVNFYVKDIQLDEDSKTGIILSESGNLFQFNLESNNITPLRQEENSKSVITCIKINQKKSELIAGYSDGKLKIFQLNNILKNNPEPKIIFSDFRAAIEIIEFNSSHSKFVVSAADKTIKLFDLTKINIKPIQLKNISSKTRAMHFNSEDDLWIASADRSIRLIETSSEKIAKKLRSSLKRNLTEKEWKELVSSELPYEESMN